MHGIQRTIKNARRYAEIIEVLARHGFEDVVAELGLDRWLDAGRRLILRAPKREAGPAPASRASRLRRAMEELGPTFIKMGQVLSCRPDLVPQAWADEFRKLQADCPRVDYSEIESLMRGEFGDAWPFSRVDPEPLAAGSMAQVHRAVLEDGTRVVAKVLRPGIEDVTATDMDILGTLAQFAEAHFSNLGYSPTEVVAEFARELRREVDMNVEARATQRLRAFFADDPMIRFPRVYERATTRRVLSLEEFEGVLLSARKEGDLSPERCRAVVEHGARAVFRQCLDLGFFHADPHPGNIFALPDGSVGFIDCGMTGQLDERTAENLATLVVGVVDADVDKVARVVQSLSDADPSVLEDRAFRADVREFVSHFEGATLAHLDMARLLQEFFDKLRAHKLRCPADLVLLIKALATIQSVGAELDPGFDMVAYARPHLERLVARRYSLGAVRRRFEGALRDYADLAEGLPGEVRTLLTQLRRNRLAVNLEHRGLGRLTQAIEHASRNIAFAMLIAGIVVASGILIHADRGTTAVNLTTLGGIGIAVALVLTAMHVVANRRWARERRRGGK